MGDIVLLGDFNARIADIDKCNKLNTDFYNADDDTVNDILRPDFVPNAKTMDTANNKYGRSLMNLCYNHSLVP